MGAGVLHCVVVTLGCHLSQSLHSSYSRSKQLKIIAALVRNSTEGYVFTERMGYPVPQKTSQEPPPTPQIGQGVPPGQNWTGGTPPDRTRGRTWDRTRGYTQPKVRLRRGRYASWHHAGGLSCQNIFSKSPK